MTGSELQLLGRWIAARVRLMLRTPRSAFFTFAFPLMLVVIFNGLNGDKRVDAMGGAGGKVDFAQFYTPSIGVFALLVACYTTLIVGVSQAREVGLLKRVRGTPLPMSTYLGSWVAGSAVIGIAAVVLLFAVAVPAYGVHLYPRMLPAALVTLALGAAALAALGLAVGSVARTADQAMPLAQLTMLPVSFVSGVWFPLSGAPDWLVHIAHFLPVYHIVNAFDACFAPQTRGGGWSPHDLLSIAIWAAVGLFVAVRRFRWEPAAGDRGLLARARSATTD